MIELNELQQQALDRRPCEALELVDPRTQRKYVLIPAVRYEDMTAMLDAADDMKIDNGKLGHHLDEIMKEDDANDPWLESYQQLKDTK